MNAIQMRLAGAGIAYLFIFLSGLWLSRTGMPYSTAVLTIHKLVALAVLVFLIATAYRMHKAAGLSGIEWVVVGAAVLFFVGTIATGGALSTGRTMPALVGTLHQVTPFLTVVMTAVALYLLRVKAESLVVWVE